MFFPADNMIASPEGICMIFEVGCSNITGVLNGHAYDFDGDDDDDNFATTKGLPTPLLVETETETTTRYFNPKLRH